MSVDDFDVFACYQDLWKTKSEKRNAIRQSIISTDRCMENCIKLRINAGDKNASNAQDKAIADAYGNKFIIPLDFEMLDTAAPYYQAGLGNRLCYKITFNDHNRVTKSGVSSPEMIINLNELDNSDNLKDGRPSNELLTYHMTDEKDFTRFEPLTPQYRKLKNGEFTSLNLRITDQNNNIITDGPQVTVVLHICDCKI